MGVGCGGIRSDFEHMPGRNEFPSKNQSGVNKANLLKEIGRSANQKAFYGCESYVLKKAIRKGVGQ